MMRTLVSISLALASLACAHPYGVPRESGATRLETELSIAASPEQVWAILVDFERYDEWNAWLPELHGEAVEGGSAIARVRLDGELRRARHRVLEVDAPRRLCWRDAGPTTWFVWAKRCRTLTRQADGGTLLHEEITLNGSFVDAALRKYGDAMQRGIEAEAASLRERAESLAPW